MNDMSSVNKAVDIVNKYHNKLALLHCTNVYPTAFESLRLNSILDLKNKFRKNIIGYSDHNWNLSLHYSNESRSTNY